MCKVTKNIALYDKIPLHKDKKVIKIWELLTKTSNFAALFETNYRISIY